MQFKKIIFNDFDHLNNWLKEYAEKKLRKSNQLKFNEEKTKLKPLPPRKDHILCRIEEFNGGAHGIVKLKKSLYSIPDCFIGQNCQAVIGPYEVKIISKSVPNHIVIHPRQAEGGKSILVGHVVRSLLRKPAAMVRWAHRDILFPTTAFKKYYGYLQGIDSIYAEKEFLKSVNLIHHVSWMELEVAISLVVENKSLQPFEDIKDLLLNEKRPHQNQYINQPKLLPNLSLYDEFISNSNRKERSNEL